MRISIRTKMFLLVTVVLMGSVLAVLWKTRSIFFEDKYDFIRQLSSKLTSSSSRLAQEKLFEYQNNIALFVGTRESLKRVRSGGELNQVLFERAPMFLAVSVQKNKGKLWETEWIQTNPSMEKKWSSQFPETIFRSLNYSTLSTGSLHLGRIEDPSGTPYFILSFLADLKEESGRKGELSSLVAILNVDFLNDVVRDYKGDLNTVFVVDNKGYILAHPQEDLVGKELGNHPIVQSILSGRESGSGQFQLEDGEAIIANFNHVPNTNAYVAISTPEKQAFLAARDLIITVITFGFGFLIIGSILAFLVSSRITKPLNELKEIAEVIGSGDFKTEVNVKSSDEVGDLAKSIHQMKVSLLERDEKIEHSKMALVQSEKMSAFGQLSAGIAHEVKNPLAGILGHAQLAKSKSKDEGISKHLDMIEKETRRTKEIIENLMRFARAEKPELTSTNLQETVSRATDLVEHQLNLQGVKIIRNIHPCSLTQANSNQIQQVLLNLMMNAGHAMDKSQVKELTISVEDIADSVQIRIQDTGSGMSPEVQKRIFEPFFTTKPAGKGTGLGLSVTIGIIQDHKGKIYIESEVGKGTTFFIEIPKVGSQNQSQNQNQDSAPSSSESLAGISSEVPSVPASSLESILPSVPSLKAEPSINKEVQRDYLKAEAAPPKPETPSQEGGSKTFEDIKKEAQEILKKEREILKQEGEKLSMELEKQQTESQKLSPTPPLQEVENRDHEELEKDLIPDTEDKVERKVAEVQEVSVELVGDAPDEEMGEETHDKKKVEKTGFKVNIRRPKLKV